MNRFQNILRFMKKPSRQFYVKFYEDYENESHNCDININILFGPRSLNKWVQKKIKILTLFFSILMLVHKN